MAFDGIICYRRNDESGIPSGVYQETSGLFPTALNDEIRRSNSFIFLIPFDGDVSFLNDQDEWPYQEIRDALFKHKIMPIRKSFQFLPVTFCKSIEWPDDLPQEISKITQFDICQLNLNNQTEVIQRKIGKALRKDHRNYDWWAVAFAFFFVVFSCFLGIRHIIKLHDDILIEIRATYKKSLVLYIINSVSKTINIRFLLRQ